MSKIGPLYGVSPYHKTFVRSVSLKRGTNPAPYPRIFAGSNLLKIEHVEKALGFFAQGLT